MKLKEIWYNEGKAYACYITTDTIEELDWLWTDIAFVVRVIYDLFAVTACVAVWNTCKVYHGIHVSTYKVA